MLLEDGVSDSKTPESQLGPGRFCSASSKLQALVLPLCLQRLLVLDALDANLVQAVEQDGNIAASDDLFGAIGAVFLTVGDA